ncbi:MAG TPA: YtxH domain-containing protein [Longimicrobium sp.]|nr:YtxH domain-containing protein [Longimicrobium sp.]
MADLDETHTFVIETRGGDGVGAFLFGVLVGAAAMVLLAPRSGAETQAEIAGAARRLREGVGGARDRVVGRVDDVRGRVRDRVDGVRDGVGSRVEQARAALDAGRGAARDAQGELRRRVEEAKRAFREGRGAAAEPDATAVARPEVVLDDEPTREDAGDLA